MKIKESLTEILKDGLRIYKENFLAFRFRRNKPSQLSFDLYLTFQTLKGFKPNPLKVL